MLRTELKVLIVGGGSAGIRHFRYLSEYGLNCSVCDPAESCRVRKEFPDTQYFQEFDSVDLESFDAVVICTPPFLHLPQAMAATNTGCHVLIEKPISISEDGLDELERIIQEKELVAGVAFPYANMLAWGRVIEIVHAGEIGELWMVACHRGINILKFRPDFYSIYYCDESQGGGCIQDEANHAILAMELLCGSVSEVTCQRHTIGIKDVEIDDTSFVWLKFKSNVVASLDWSNQCHFEHSDWIISGSNGGIHFDLGEMKIQVFDADTEKMHEEKFDDSWNETFRRNDKNFIDAIRGITSVRCGLQQARTSLRTVLAAKESARLGKTVNLTL